MSAIVAILQGPRWCPWCGDHMGWGGGWLMGLFWILLLAVVIAAALRAFSQRSGGADDRRASAILGERYARGEIDEETYRRMREELRR